MAAPEDLNVESFQDCINQTDSAVLVSFWSQTCPHCREFAPHFAAAAEQGREGVRFAKVCAQEAIDLFREHQVTAVPTLVLFRSGSEVARQPGSRSAEEVLAWLDEKLTG